LTEAALVLDFNHRPKPPSFADRMNSLIDGALVDADLARPPRGYLGGSRLGDPCQRRLQYEYLDVPRDDGASFLGLQLHIFAAGHAFEDLVVGWLRAAGFDLRTHNRAGEQFGFSVAGGRIQGHVDGVIVGGPDGFAYPALWECKSANAKNWRESADRSAAPPSVQPDAGMIGAFMDAVFGYCEGFVPIRALAEKGGPDRPPHTPFITADGELAAKTAVQAAWAADAGMALYAVPGTVNRPGDARAEDVAQTQVVLVDLDHGDIAKKRQHLVRHLGEPSIEVASGGVTADGQAKLHLYWRLTEAAEGEDIARVCRLRHMIAVKAGGDPAFRSPHQPIRLPARSTARTAPPGWCASSESRRVITTSPSLPRR
jgi:hypothetical protein